MPPTETEDHADVRDVRPPGNRAVPMTAYYREKYGFVATDFPVSFEWGEGTITLPLYPSLTVEEQDYIIATVRDVVVPMIT